MSYDPTFQGSDEVSTSSNVESLGTSSGPNSGSESTSTGHSPSSKGNFGADTTRERLGKRETENVNKLRYVVLGILLAAAIGISVLVYYITRSAENEEISTQFEAAAGRIQEAFRAIRTERIGTLSNMGVAAIAHGVDHSRDWPFVSLSFYQQRAFAAKANSGALQVSIAPWVQQSDRALWEEYVVSDEAEVDWIELSLDYQDTVGLSQFIRDYGTTFRGPIPEGQLLRDPYPIQRLNGFETAPIPDSASGEYLPFWEMSPFLSFRDVNVNLYEEGDIRGVYGNQSLAEAAIVMGEMVTAPPGDINSFIKETSDYAQLLSIDAETMVEYQGDPLTYVFVPVFDSFEDDRKPIALLVGLFHWGNLLSDVLEEQKGIDVVLRNTCSEPFTYRLEGPEVVPRGPGDLHESKYDSSGEDTAFLEVGRVADGTKTGIGFADRDCNYYLSIYPSDSFAQSYREPIPAILVSSVAAVFVFAILMFFVYDRLVERRQSLVLRKAVQSTAIVSSLFPKTVRERLMESSHLTPENNNNKTLMGFRERARASKKGGNSASVVPPALKENGELDDDDGPPIADLFPNCTVLFADIAGFTAWSSTRDPAQVFTLLQNLYKAFDRVAMRRRVFKVETIGDSYVAVTGLPEPQADHAIIMAKFAKDCLQKMHEVTRALEIRLGPDTNDLSMRIGMNSGQVTGGVLRGDRARFQLFGDTVNTAARMESTGERGRIQLSQSSADLLVLAGKEHWIQARSDQVAAKGKGLLQTYWLEMDGPKVVATNHEDDLGKRPSTRNSLNSAQSGQALNKQTRSIGWMTEVLQDYVKKIVAKNNAAGILIRRGSSVPFKNDPTKICFDELVESFDLVEEDAAVNAVPVDYRAIELDPVVTHQLQKYVEAIATRYQAENPFHNFEHACHVTMSVHKLMKRVVGDGNDDWVAQPSDDQRDERLATYGILTSDPLTLFAIVFSGLVHDVDHRGVSNVQLANEEPELARHYRKQSIAEQNSFDIAWDTLMSTRFEHLRRVLFPTSEALLRFRQVVINTVLATDIFDKHMGDMRKERWNRVFGENIAATDSKTKVTRATIVLEHIIQASDVSHTMQHWHVYVKWNRRLFSEMRLAHKQGRMASDPASFWYEGELKFFDNYVIPLAKKLEECQVFGVSSSEYLNYATSNRAEWEAKGRDVVDEMVNATAE